MIITRKLVTEAFILLFILAIFGIVGEMDKNDEVRFRADYCANVHRQALPGHERTEAESCRDLGERSAAR